jgi:hypothetical protein
MLEQFSSSLSISRVQLKHLGDKILKGITMTREERLKAAWGEVTFKLHVIRQAAYSRPGGFISVSDELEDFGELVDLPVPLKKNLPQSHLPKHAAYRPNVNRLIISTRPIQYLGSSVKPCDHISGQRSHRIFIMNLPCKPKITEFQFTF